MNPRPAASWLNTKHVNWGRWLWWDGQILQAGVVYVQFLSPQIAEVYLITEFDVENIKHW